MQSPNPTYIQHFQLAPTDEGRRCGRVTVAIRGAEVAAAWCSPRDQFSRRRGRLIAEGRLEKRTSPKGKRVAFPFIRPTRDADEKIGSWLRRVFVAGLAVALENAPTWAKREAEESLRREAEADRQGVVVAHPGLR